MIKLFSSFGAFFVDWANRNPRPFAAVLIVVILMAIPLNGFYQHWTHPEYETWGAKTDSVKVAVADLTRTVEKALLKNDLKLEDTDRRIDRLENGKSYRPHQTRNFHPQDSNKVTSNNP